MFGKLGDEFTGIIFSNRPIYTFRNCLLTKLKTFSIYEMIKLDDQRCLDTNFGTKWDTHFLFSTVKKSTFAFGT